SALKWLFRKAKILLGIPKTRQATATLETAKTQSRHKLEFWLSLTHNFALKIYLRWSTRVADNLQWYPPHERFDAAGSGVVFATIHQRERSANFRHTGRGQPNWKMDWQDRRRMKALRSDCGFFAVLFKNYLIALWRARVEVITCGQLDIDLDRGALRP